MSGSGEAARTGRVLYTAPLSFTQAGILFTTLLHPNRPPPCVAAAYRPQAALDPVALAAALGTVAERHAILRTTFDPAGPSQRVHAELPIPLRVVDLRPLGARARAAAAAHAANAKREAPDVVRGTPWRADVIRLGEDDTVVLLIAHHLVADDISMAIWVRELQALHAGGTAGELPPLPLQYADYAVWQRGWLDERAQRPLLDYWQARLAGVPACTALPPDAGLAPDPSPGSTTAPLLGPGVDGLRALAAHESATLFVPGLAVFAELMGRRTGQRTVVVGSVVSGRARPEITNAIGPFANILPFRIDRDPEARFRDLLRQVRGVVVDGLTHQAVPFARIVEQARLERDPGFGPLAQTGFAMAEVTPMHGDGDGAGLPTGPGASPFDLELVATTAAGGGAAAVTYRRELYRPATAEALGRSFAALAAAVALDPDRPLAHLGAGDAGTSSRAVPSRPRKPRRSRRLTGGAVPDLIAERARRRPEAPAISGEGGRLSAGELLGRADALASRLLEVGAGPEVPIGVLLNRSADLLVAALAVMRSGAVYVPLDPDGPSERLGLMVEDLALQHVVTAGDAEELPGARGLRRIPVGTGPTAARPAIPRVRLEDAAYIMFTSGSTGRPKGVVVEHGALRSTLLAVLDQVHVGPGDRLLAVTPPTFDISLLELLLPLLVGAEVVVAGREACGDGRRLLRLALQSGTTVLQATPATWRMLVEADAGRELRVTALCGGDALHPDLAGHLRARGGRQWNLYGPTEATIWASALALHETVYDRVLIGPPLGDATFHVLDGGLRPVPPGAAGELFIGGPGLARGYLGRPDLTAERFLHGTGGRIYRTGDLVRARPDGAYEFLGRVDDQVKVRGFRIEPAEVESALCAHPSVTGAAVVAELDGTGERQLVAYIRPAGADPAPEALADFVRRRLPGHMVPSRYVAVDRLPVTWNGKIDRRRLTPGSGRRLTGGRPAAAAATETEQTLAALCAELLGLRDVGLDDDFFALGGHSLLTIQLIGRLRERTGVDLALSTVFERRTVRGLAAAVDAARAGRGSPTGEPQLVRRTRR